jgi:adenine-specific DNA-methyltransferase
MQTTLIQRYLGNKSTITREIVEIIGNFASPGELVFDAFSGSLAVSSALRGAGYEVACNDINHFSWLFAQAYFSSTELPQPPLIGGARVSDRFADWTLALTQLIEPYKKRSEIPAKFRRTDIFDHYCEDGSRSAFTSSRGQSGRRRFFSPENATLIDRALNRIRFHYHSGLINLQARCILTAALISSVEKVSNTQGTYHDFPRELIDQRALKLLSLKMPSKEVFEGPASNYIGKAEDTLDFVRRLPKHKVIYLDPPYNFRQYTSYYFMLNLLSSHAEIEDLDQYFDNLEFVRGQNMATDFKSTFCSKKHFIPSLSNLIENAQAEYVVLSYFDGANHWGQFKSDKAQTTGRDLIEDFFRSDMFQTGSLQCIPVKRMNYQSYGGFTAKLVQEFLFVAKKCMHTDVNSGVGENRWIGQVMV